MTSKKHMRLEGKTNFKELVYSYTFGVHKSLHPTPPPTLSLSLSWTGARIHKLYVGPPPCKWGVNRTSSITHFLNTQNRGS